MLATLWKIGLVATWLASVPVGGPTSDWTQFGLAGAVVAFVLWRDYRREDRFQSVIAAWEARVDKLQLWIQAKLMTALSANTRALEQIESCPLKRDYLKPKGNKDDDANGGS